MRFKKNYLLIVLLIFLGGFYAINIFSINKLAALVVERPVKLSFIIIRPNSDMCEGCFEAQSIISIIRNTHNIKITKNKTLDPSSFRYDRLIKQYDIKNLPAVIVRGDISNQRITGSWAALGGESKEDGIVIQNLLPYYDFASDEIKGLVTATVIVDNKCEKCFDGEEYLKIMERQGMIINNFLSYDVSSSEGSALILKYGITKIPSLVLSPGAKEYQGFTQSWEEVGTEEEDGVFVLREVQKLGGVYKEI